MTSQHKRAPLSYRPPKDSGDEEWLREHAKQTGRSINAIFADAVITYRDLGAWARAEAERRGVSLSMILTEALSNLRAVSPETRNEDTKESKS
jgi:hypothetical protein